MFKGNISEDNMSEGQMLIQQLDLNGISMLHALDPPLRKLSFSEIRACRNHVIFLREAWRRFPPKQIWEDACKEKGGKRIESQRDAFLNFMTIFSHDRHDLDEAVFTINEDIAETHSEWRKVIYYRWCHIWWDVSNFIKGLHPNMGHWHQPYADQEDGLPHGELVIRHENRGDQARWMHWHKNIIMAPVYFDKNIKIRVHRQPVPREGPPHSYPYAGTWTKDMLWDVWYVRSDVELRLEVIDLEDVSKTRSGVAAVFVFARLCVGYDKMNPKQAARALLKYTQQAVNMGEG